MIHNDCAALGIQEEILALSNIGLLNCAGAAIDTRENACGGQQLQGIPQADLTAMLRDLVQGRFCDIETFNLGAQPDDSLDLLGRVGVGGDDKKAGKQIRGIPCAALIS